MNLAYAAHPVPRQRPTPCQACGRTVVTYLAEPTCRACRKMGKAEPRAVERQPRSTKYDLAAIYGIVERNPGTNPTLLASMAGVSYFTIYNLLPTMEAHGFIMSEDDRGGLYPRWWGEG